MRKYDPSAPGALGVATRDFEARDTARGRTFPCAAWHPRSSGCYPLVVFSHASGHHRRGATYLCAHLASHGYVVGALDHSEVVAPELRAQPGETSSQKAARWQALIDARVPDVRFLIDWMLTRWDDAARLDPDRIGIAGHSFGGWTALAAIDVDPRIGAVAALAPGGASKRKPGILPCTLDFRWGRDVPVLFVVAADDTSLPLEGMREIFERTPATRRMVILEDADHMHFMDGAQALHEEFRTMPATGDIAELQRGMRPFAELAGEQPTHERIRGLVTAHMDAVLKGHEEARDLLDESAGPAAHIQ